MFSNLVSFQSTGPLHEDFMVSHVYINLQRTINSGYVWLWNAMPFLYF